VVIAAGDLQPAAGKTTEKINFACVLADVDETAGTGGARAETTDIHVATAVGLCHAQESLVKPAAIVEIEQTPYRNGTTHVIFEPVDFIAKLVALVPKPRVNLTRFHGVFAPNSKHRALVSPVKRVKGNKSKAADGPEEQAPVQRHAAMTWAQRLKRVFKLDVETCRVCGGSARVIACIEDPVVIKKILTYLEEKLPTRAALLLPDSRAPP